MNHNLAPLQQFYYYRITAHPAGCIEPVKVPCHTANKFKKNPQELRRLICNTAWYDIKYHHQGGGYRDILLRYIKKIGEDAAFKKFCASVTIEEIRV